MPQWQLYAAPAATQPGTQHLRQVPQLLMSLSVSAPPEQPPHWQLLPQAWVPVQLQGCVSPGAHAPQHGLHTPLQHVGVEPAQDDTA
jgi:hypothetical protein